MDFTGIATSFSIQCFFSISKENVREREKRIGETFHIDHYLYKPLPLMIRIYSGFQIELDC